MKSSTIAPILALLASLAACGNSESETATAPRPTTSGDEQAAGSGTDAGVSESTVGDAAVSNTGSTNTGATDAGTPAAAAPAAENTPAAPVTPAPATPAPEPSGPPALTGGARATFQQGVEAGRAGNLEAALSAFQQVLASEPRAAQAAYNAGIIAERQGNVGEA